MPLTIVTSLRTSHAGEFALEPTKVYRRDTLRTAHSLLTPHFPGSPLLENVEMELAEADDAMQTSDESSARFECVICGETQGFSEGGEDTQNMMGVICLLQPSRVLGELPFSADDEWLPFSSFAQKPTLADVSHFCCENVYVLASF